MATVPRKQFLTWPVDPFNIKLPHACKSLSENPSCFISSKEIILVSDPVSIRYFFIGKFNIKFLFLWCFGNMTPFAKGNLVLIKLLK